MRFVIYGAGAVGGTIGARLHLAGRDVLLIARGAHLEVLRRDGLHFATPDDAQRLRIPVAGSPSDDEIAITADDVVFLTMKTQDTAPALLELRGVVDPAAAIVCAQNGVENERLALRQFANVYGMCVYLPAQHLEPGSVQAFASPTTGVLDLGRTPHGVDERASQIAAALAQSGFASQARSDIMRWKYSKLLANLGNATDVLFGPGRAPDFRARPDPGDVRARARAEALACYEAAGIERTDDQAAAARHEAMSPLRPVGATPHRGGSSWQSLERRSGSIETDYLNGEIVLLGRLHGVPTPVNEALRDVAAQMTRDGAAPGTADPTEFEQLVNQLAPA
jgi:2-dehydropantoate 2-reductase